MFLVFSNQITEDYLSKIAQYDTNTQVKTVQEIYFDYYVINKNVFDGINLSKSTLCVPVGSRTQYENSLGWNNFGKIIEQ